MASPLLELIAITKSYPRPGRWWWPVGNPAQTPAQTRVLGPVALTLAAGESVGLVGESGSGKTTLARIAAGLIPPTTGQVYWEGVALAALAPSARAAWRRQVQYVFQHPLAALNPRRRIGASLDWTLRGLTRLERAGRASRIDEVAAWVGLGTALLGRYPHELSGGQAQRVAIARALLGAPRLLILDEPVAALDVSLQAQVLDLLAHLRERLGLGYLFISHDLAVVERLCSRLLVMQAGQVCEQGPRETILAAPHHPYTRALLQAVPRLPPGAAYQA
ncbi:MAG: ABC transporter ATP-binding protein [Chromatiaceae bacterium]|nr:MAG: ABC transporter ATP-binding protein [Chromatiaceae bacterium]